MALGKQGKIKKRNVMVFVFYLQNVNGTYHDWLVIIGSQTRTQTLFMCVCRLRQLSGRLRSGGCYEKG